MSNNSPVFDMSGNQHFGDYGFHPHFEYFQVAEEARKHKSENEGGAPSSARCLQFKLQKANISQLQLNNAANTMKKNEHKHYWWKNALLFLIKTKCTSSQDHHHRQQSGVHPINSYAPPVYTTESRRSGTTTPHRTTSRPTSGQPSPAMMGDTNNMPYINLDDINSTDQQNRRPSAISTMPIYLVT